MAFGMRKSTRVNFERGVDVFIMGIDGTWRRSCVMFDVSQTGARLQVENSIEGLDLREFFLLLSSTGLAFRRCKLVRVDGDQIGIEFLAPSITRQEPPLEMTAIRSGRRVLVAGDNVSRLSAVRAMLDQQFNVSMELLASMEVRGNEIDAVVVAADLRLIENIAARKGSPGN